jgi:CDP-diacylglycerol pyrophosphatase
VRPILPLIVFLMLAALTGAVSAQTPSCPAPPLPPHDIIGKIADACTDSCREADFAHHFAIIKDNGRDKPAAFLFVARDCNARGIEDAATLSVTPLLNAWAYAWDEAEKWLEPSAETQMSSEAAWIGIEVNAGNVDSAGHDISRSMDRLHIHMACVLPDVIDALRTMKGETATMHFTAEPGIDFTITRETSLRGPDSPFLLLPTDTSAWRDRTIAVFGRRDTAAYYVAVGTGPANQPISGEDLLDQRCATPAYGR